MIPLILSAASLFSLGYAQSATTLPAPGQPQRTGIPGGFELIGESLVSAQQLFLGTEDKVIFIDKVEGNPAQINGHPAWASEWAVGSNQQRPMEVVTNSFCAGGSVLGNGTWLNVGGNEAVTFGGAVAGNQADSGAPYFNVDGRTSIRMYSPCDDGNCEWTISPVPSDQRWYPTLETLPDGSIIIIGGCRFGGYVNNFEQDNPTYQFFPPRGAGQNVPFDLLSRTLPANLYPLTWLLPSGKLLIQSNWATSLLDYNTNEETRLDDIPDAVRVYPASAGSIMLPLTPANGWNATILFCGGSNVQIEQWTATNFIKTTYGGSTSCVKISPDSSRSYIQEDPLPEARVMVNLIFLPDGKILTINGAALGTAGYGNDTWAIGHSYADNPVYRPAIYDPDATTGNKWSSEGLAASTVARLYHSSAVLLPDGSIMVSGSNPNPDFVAAGPNIQYPTEYRTELWYPTWYKERRPQPQGLLSQLSYGGPSFDITLDSEDLFGDVQNAETAKVTIVRPGFSTHNINMGQRFVQLDSSYTAYGDNTTAVLHVSQLPPNPSVLAPGPALIFVVVKGVASVGKMVMIGSGTIGTQTPLEVADLPPSEVLAATGGGGNGTTTGDGSGAVPSREHSAAGLAAALIGCVVAALWS